MTLKLIHEICNTVGHTYNCTRVRTKYGIPLKTLGSVGLVRLTPIRFCVCSQGWLGQN